MIMLSICVSSKRLVVRGVVIIGPIPDWMINGCRKEFKKIFDNPEKNVSSAYLFR
jgi:hypothetical protein